MKKYPQLRHNYKCEDPRCPYCWEDSKNLEKFFKQEIGAGNLDYLGRYGKWLYDIKKFPEPETEYGWFNPEVFSPEIIDEFVAYYKNIFKNKKYKNEWEVRID